MAIAALHSASSGLSALSQNLDVIANNLANTNTVGFKTSRGNFEDLLYQEKAQPGVLNAVGDQTPAGLFVGLGVRLSNTQLNFEQGSPVQTGEPTNMMIQGSGFFRVRTLESVGEGVGYTRAGNFTTNSEGDLVLGNSQGNRLDPPVNVPQGATDVSISSTGSLSYELDGVPVENAAQLTIYSFPNSGGLISKGSNVYTTSLASGEAVEGEPGDPGFGTVLGGYQESSNADPVKELVELIKTQRAFEMNSQSIKAADEALSVISNLTRF